ncbi:MAG: FecR family protein [Gammaproteobacteria bacterium]|nr:FecR family protein [Gammaproteobacteria bacterium]MBU1482791.1 FecR family protein [Gammaproteobacteria bacterium]
MNADIECGSPQRRRLLQGFAAGVLTVLLPAVKAIAATFTPPPRLPATQSVYRVRGKAWVNGKRVDANTRIGPNDTVKTGRNSELVFVVGDHAMILRGRSHLVIEPKEANEVSSLLIGGLRLFAGKLLSVSRNKGMRIETPSATIGIRGTGVYLEAGPDKTYFCNCYGEVDVEANGDATSNETVVSTHHDKPLYIYGQGRPGHCIHDANRLARPNHSDDELLLAEALVGRVPPFAM